MKTKSFVIKTSFHTQQTHTVNLQIAETFEELRQFGMSAEWFANQYHFQITLPNIREDLQRTEKPSIE